MLQTTEVSLAKLKQRWTLAQEHRGVGKISANAENPSSAGVRFRDGSAETLSSLLAFESLLVIQWPKSGGR